MKNENQQPTQLTPEKFQAIMGAYSRLVQLGECSVSTGPNDNRLEEKEKIVEFLATELLTYCGEFIACYDITHREYLPACNALLKIARRCGYLPTPPPAPHNPVNYKNN